MRKISTIKTIFEDVKEDEKSSVALSVNIHRSEISKLKILKNNNASISNYDFEAIAEAKLSEDLGEGADELNDIK